MHSLYDLLLQITGIVLCVAYRQKADLQVRTTLKRSLTENYTINQARDPVTLIWDLVMSRMECCGVNDYTDFQNAAKFQSEVLAEGLGRKIPDSCCAKNVTNLSVSDENLSDWNGNTQILESDQCISLPSRSNSYMYQVRWTSLARRSLNPSLQGCYTKFIAMASENLNVLFGSLIGLGLVQFVAILFAFCICKVRLDPSD